MRKSCLDHVYNKNHKIKVDLLDLNVGDHLGLDLNLTQTSDTRPNKEKIYIRDWTKYSKENLILQLNKMDRKKFNYLSANQASEMLDQDLMLALSTSAPEILIKPDEKGLIWSVKLIKQRRRKANLLKKARKKKLYKTLETMQRTRQKHTTIDKNGTKKKIRNTINPEDQQSFWKAINIAKAQPPKTDIPNTVEWNQKFLQQSMKKLKPLGFLHRKSKINRKG